MNTEIFALDTFHTNIIVPPYDGNWSLSGHDANDPTNNVITKDKWYSFMSDMANNAPQELGAADSNIRRVLDDAGGYEEKKSGEDSSSS